MKRRGLLAVLVCLSALAMADEQADYDAGVQWALQSDSALRSSSSYGLNVTEYCADSECENKVNNPPEASLSEAELQSKSQSAYYSDEQAQSVQDGFDKGRPDVKHDPAYAYALIGQENAYEISHGLSNEYVDCTTGSQCVDDTTTKSCEVPTYNPVSCYKTPEVEGQSIETGTLSVDLNNKLTPISINLPVGVTSIVSIDLPLSYALCMPQGSMRCLLVIRNGGSVYTKDLSHLKSDINCANFTCTTRVFPQTFSTNMPITSNQVTFTLGVGTDANFTESPFIVFYGTMRIHWQKKVNNIVWKTDCGTMLPECQQKKSTCIEPGETRWINGVPTTLSCWKYEQTYQCEFDNTCEALNECATVSQSCSLEQKGVCVQEEVIKSCTTTTCKATNLQCGAASFCLDGDCYSSTPQLNNEFDKSVSALAGLSAAAEDLGDPPVMFTGKAMMCTDKAFGFADCCKGSGWGTDVGLASCSDEEKALGQAREKKLTISLGEYCAKKVLGKCVKKKQSFCVYDSLLAQIIQEQGVKGQLGRSFGSAEHPICDAITPEELEKINFDYLDFTNFYADMNNQTQLPDSKEIQQRIQSAYEH